MKALDKLVALFSDLGVLAQVVVNCIAGLYLVNVLYMPVWNAGKALLESGSAAFSSNLVGLGVASVLLCVANLKAPHQG